MTEPRWILVYHGEEWMVCELRSWRGKRPVWTVVAKFTDDARALAYFREQESAVE